MVWRFGETVPWRQAYFDTSWRRWEFWLFSAVASFAVIPVCEELFFRGYCQRRLAEDWGDGAAIAGASSLFVFSHSQYIMADAYNMAMVVTLLLSAVGFGVVFAWTRSIVPSIVAHAIFNLPMRPGWTTLIIGAFVIGALLLARSAVAVARRVFSSARVPVLLALGVIGAVFGVAADRVPVLSFAGIGMVLTAVAIETRDRHAKPLPTNAAA
jgi:membrane protease YdiL (CAAX protease family)